MASMNYSAALATTKPTPPEMTCTSALAAFNAVMAADPVIVALGERAWGDVVYEEEMEEKRRAPRAPKKAAPPTGVRCMASGIYDDQGHLVAGLSISAPADRLDEEWLPKLQATTQSISHALGYKVSVG